MSPFIKLTNTLINTHYIQKIVIKHDMYHIHMMSNKVSGMLIFGAGTLDAHNHKIEVCKKEDSRRLCSSY
jgi:hypothetical protein